MIILFLDDSSFFQVQYLVKRTKEFLEPSNVKSNGLQTDRVARSQTHQVCFHESSITNA